MRFARAEVGGVLAVAKPGAAKLFPEPSDAGAHHGEDEGFQHFRVGGPAAAGQQEPKHKTEQGRQQTRTTTAKSRSAKDRGNEDEEGAPITKPGMKCPRQHKQDRNSRRPRNILCAERLGVEEA